MNLIEELRWRGLIQDIIPGTEEKLAKDKVVGYCGFDPTSDCLHIGSLVPIILLKHLQNYGHTPIALIGGATGMVGDPSGKSEERNMLSKEQLLINEKGVKKQLEKFIDFTSTALNAAMLTNNYDWFKEYTFLDFIREVGKHITVNYMMAKDSVKKRLETGMSFTEFTYQLVQGYDFYHLYKNKNAVLQIGGSDQWGNIVTGTELIRRKLNGEAFAFTAPLIKKADGGKFGKTESGNIWLDASKTSPYNFYQFWLNTSDEDAEKYIKIFTFLPQAEIEEITQKHNENTAERLLQKKLAEEITTWVHNKDLLEFSQKASSILFNNNTADVLVTLSESEIEDVMAGVPRCTIAAKQIQDGIDIVTFMLETKIFPSKSEARKMIEQGGVSINKNKITEVQEKITQDTLLKNKFILVQKGKKNYYLVTLL